MFFKNSTEFSDADMEFSPNTSIYTNEIKDKTKNANSRSNLKEGRITLFTLTRCSALFLHHSYFENENFLLVLVSSSFSVSLFQWDKWRVSYYSTGFFFLSQRLTSLLY